MAKNRERQLAKELYMKGKQQNEIASLVNVQEKTVGDWVKKYNWKAERDSRVNSQSSTVENYKRILSMLSQKRLDLIPEMEKAEAGRNEELMADLTRRSMQIADEVSRYNKALENLDQENRVSLSTYIGVMDDIFKALQEYDPKLFMKLLDFQEEHLSDISLKLG